MPALHKNIATAQRERERRFRAVAEGEMDPFSSAQSSYMGPGWGAFFGSMRENAEAADAAGMNYRVNWSGFGDGGSMPRRGGAGSFSGELNPLEQDALKDAIRSQAASQAVDEAKFANAVQKDYTDRLQAETLGSLRGAYDQMLTDRAFAMPEERSKVTRTPGGPGQAPTVRVERDPAAPPMSEVERQLRMLPPHLRPAYERQLAEMQAKGMTAEAALTKAQAELRRSQAPDAQEPLVSIMGPDNQPILVPRSQAVNKRPASTREQGRPVTSGDAGKIADFDTSLDDLSVLRSTLTETKDATGTSAAIGAALPAAVTDFTGWGTDAKKRQGVIDRVKQVIGKALEGGVLRKEDEAKYEKILPTIRDTAAVAESKLNGLETALIQRRQTTIDALSDAGYETSRFQARPPRQGSAAAAPPAAAAGGRMRVKGPNGETGTVPAGTSLPPGWSAAGG